MCTWNNSSGRLGTEWSLQSQRQNAWPGAECRCTGPNMGQGVDLGRLRRSKHSLRNAGVHGAGGNHPRLPPQWSPERLGSCNAASTWSNAAACWPWRKSKACQRLNFSHTCRPWKVPKSRCRSGSDWACLRDSRRTSSTCFSLRVTCPRTSRTKRRTKSLTPQSWHVHSFSGRRRSRWRRTACIWMLSFKLRKRTCRSRKLLESSAAVGTGRAGRAHMIYHGRWRRCQANSCREVHGNSLDPYHLIPSCPSKIGYMVLTYLHFRILCYSHWINDV